MRWCESLSTHQAHTATIRYADYGGIGMRGLCLYEKASLKINDIGDDASQQLQRKSNAREKTWAVRQTAVVVFLDLQDGSLLSSWVGTSYLGCVCWFAEWICASKYVEHFARVVLQIALHVF